MSRRRRGEQRFYALSPARDPTRISVRSTDRAMDPPVVFSVSPAKVDAHGMDSVKVKASLATYHPTAKVPVRAIAARLPTLVLLDELAKRLHSEGVAVLTDALLGQGHRLGILIAHLPGLYTASRRGS